MLNAVAFRPGHDGPMQRDLPLTLVLEPTAQAPASLLASPAFWLGGALSFAVWTALALSLLAP